MLMYFKSDITMHAAEHEWHALMFNAWLYNVVPPCKAGANASHIKYNYL